MVLKSKGGKTKIGKADVKKAKKPLAKKPLPKKPRVIVYTAEWCPWCHKVMDFLKLNKVAFVARDVDNQVFAQEAVEKSGQSGIPVVIVGSEVVIGFDEIKLKALLNLK